MSTLLPNFLTGSGDLDTYQRIDLIRKRVSALIIVCSFILVICFFAALFTPGSLALKALFSLPVLVLPIIAILVTKNYVPIFAKKSKKELLAKRLRKKKIDYLENIIQNSNDVILTVDNDLLMLKFNKGAEYHLGYTQVEVLGKPLSMFFTNGSAAEVVNAVNSTGNVVSMELPFKTKLGAIRQFNVSIAKMNYGNAYINGFVVTAKDITEKKILEKELIKTNKQLNLLAITDSLTELYNVRHFYDQIKRELKRFARNPQRKLSLILIDIDHFKELNDAEGHQMGDHVLASLAQVIMVCIRQDIDSAYRYGGDEFIIILPDTDKVQADVVARRIQKQFGAFKFGTTSLSIGITEAHMNDNEETIVKRADDAMYSSKRSGKGVVSVT